METDGRALATVKTLTSGGIGVDAVDMTAPTHEEIQILGVEMPEDKVLVGKAVTLKVTVQNNYLSAKKVSLVVADKGFEGTRLTLKSSRASRHWKCRSPFRRRDCMTCASPDSRRRQPESEQQFPVLPQHSGV